MISRRTLLELAAQGMVWAATAPRLEAVSDKSDKSFTLRNEAIEFSLGFAGGKFASRSFQSRITNEHFHPSSEDVTFEFGSGEILRSSEASARLLAHSPQMLQYELSWGDVTAQVHYQLAADKGYLRKQLAVQSKSPRRLIRVDLERWKDVPGDWKSMKADKFQYGSHPIHTHTLFAGVEFVTAFNEYDENGFVLRSRPGGTNINLEPYSLNSTVIGVSHPGEIRKAFLDYLEDIRLPPTKLVTCYNSWWTLPLAVKQEDNLNLIRTLKERLHDRHGIFFDLVTIDGGWSDRRSVWSIDRVNLPNGLSDARTLVESAEARLGLWMSPSEFYPECCDYAWMEAQDFTVLRRQEAGKLAPFGVSLADPNFRNAVTRQLPKLIRENNLGHIKYDGFAAQELTAHHDLLPGEDSVEPLAHYALELLEVSKRADPTLVTEPTFMNSMVNYISPWILKYSTSVWANAGGDCPIGMNPAPDYRESNTNAREYYIFSSLNEVWLPQNAVQYFDIIHCDDAGGFPNHAAMAFLRGRFFVPTYINPRFMQDDDWRIYAGLLQWARANQDILRHTEVLPSRVEMGEPYVYAHWLGNRGVIAIRNPSNLTCFYTLDLATVRAPRGLTNGVCYTQYPYRKGIAAKVGSRSTLPLQLAPWELLVIEIVPQSELRELVAIGARWYSEPDGSTGIVANPGSEEVRCLNIHNAERVVPVTSRPSGELRGHVTEQSVRQLWQSDWLTGNAGPVPSVGCVFECEVTVPVDSTGRLLLLIEYPGRGYWPSLFNATVNGLAVLLGGSSSDGHVGYPLTQEPWKSAIQPFESHWKWYDCPVSAGLSHVKLVGTIGFEHAKIGMYLWSEQDIKQLAQTFPFASTRSAMPEYRSNVERQSICLRQPARLPAQSLNAGVTGPQ